MNQLPTWLPNTKKHSGSYLQITEKYRKFNYSIPIYNI